MLTPSQPLAKPCWETILQSPPPSRCWLWEVGLLTTVGEMVCDLSESRSHLWLTPTG